NLPAATFISLPECRTPVTALHGFQRRDNANPLSFVWDDTTRAFVWGQTYYQIVNNARCELDNSLGTPCTDLYAWRTSIDNTKNRRIAKVRLLIAPWNALGRGSGLGSDITGASGPFVRTSGGTGPYDRSQLDFNHWKALDTVIRDLYDKGVIAELIVFRDTATSVPNGCGTGDSLLGTVDEDKRYLGYAVARYAAFPNVIWSLTNEWQCTNTPASRWDTLGGCLKNGCSDSFLRAYLGDPWFAQGSNLRPLTVHPAHKFPAMTGPIVGQCFSFFGSAWPSSVSLQRHKISGDPASDQVAYDSVMCNKPGGTCQGTNNKSWPVSND